jgi:hypothetical protein
MFVYFITVFLMPVPNIMVEWLTLLLHIREVPVSNLCPDTNYLD